MSEIAYLPHGAIQDMKVTETPAYGRTASGYGSKIPTRYMIKLRDGVWRRVYVMVYGNSGSPYVLILGAVRHLESDTEHALEAL